MKAITKNIVPLKLFLAIAFLACGAPVHAEELLNSSANLDRLSCENDIVRDKLTGYCNDGGEMTITDVSSIKHSPINRPYSVDDPKDKLSWCKSYMASNSDEGYCDEKEGVFIITNLESFKRQMTPFF